MNAKVIALLNEKGGVGKSTSATAIAYILAKQGKKVCTIDFDDARTAHLPHQRRRVGRAGLSMCFHSGILRRCRTLGWRHRLTNIERETIVNFNEQEDIATLYTYNQKLMKRFDKLAQSRPDLVSRTEDNTGAVTFTLPKKLLTITAREPISEVEQQIRRERVQQHRFAPKTPR